MASVVTSSIADRSAGGWVSRALGGLASTRPAASPIDTVSYGTLKADGTVAAEQPFEWYEQTEEYGPWNTYEITTNPDYASQADYVAAKKAEVLALGGQADDLEYRMPVQNPTTFKRTYTADLAVAATAPVQDSTVTSSWTSRGARSASEQRNPASFVH